MGKRARVKDRGLPRRRRPCCAIAAAGAILAGVAMVDPVRAQSPVSDLYAPSLTIDAGNPPSFSDTGTRSTDTPGRFRRVLTDGNPPPPGAGRTGFVSRTPRAVADPQGLALPPDPVTDAAAGPAIVTGGVDGMAAPVRSRRRPVESGDPYEPLGLRLGSFVVKPAVEISGGYDSNPERSTSARGGGALIVAPELEIRSDWSRHEFRADVRGRYKTYPGFDATPSLNQPFVDSKVAARIDVTRRTRVELEGRFVLSTEDPNSPDLPASLARLPVTMTGGVTAGVTQQFNRVELGVSGSLGRTVYDNSTLTNGTSVSNEDRNYDERGARLRGSYEMVPGVKPFVEVGLDRRTHDLPVDSSGVRRDSTGSEVRIGTTFELTRQLTGSVSVGYAERRYEDPTLSNLHGLIADGSLVWTATPLTKVTFTARSRIDESTLTGVSGVLRRDLGVQVDHSLRRWLIGTVKFEYGFDDYVGSARVDERFAVAGLLTYKLSRNVQLKGEVRRQWLTSNAPGANYTADIFLLGLRLQR